MKVKLIEAISAYNALGKMLRQYEKGEPSALSSLRASRLWRRLESEVSDWNDVVAKMRERHRVTEATEIGGAEWRSFEEEARPALEMEVEIEDRYRLTEAEFAYARMTPSETSALLAFVEEEPPARKSVSERLRETAE
ncbi:MAG: hypothetical protein GF419_04335 [Ignavibacteriales bacterium]|nr:hypothetical protein [Ignavibacteriales bacterium]